MAKESGRAIMESHLTDNGSTAKLMVTGTKYGATETATKARLRTGLKMESVLRSLRTAMSTKAITSTASLMATASSPVEQARSTSANSKTDLSTGLEIGKTNKAILSTGSTPTTKRVAKESLFGPATTTTKANISMI